MDIKEINELIDFKEIENKLRVELEEIREIKKKFEDNLNKDRFTKSVNGIIYAQYCSIENELQGKLMNTINNDDDSIKNLIYILKPIAIKIVPANCHESGENIYINNMSDSIVKSIEENLEEKDYEALKQFIVNEWNKTR